MRTVTIGEIKRRARQRADMVHSDFVSDTELIDMINESYCMLYDLLVAAFQNYYVASDTFTLVPGTTAYDLPDDFYKLIAVDLANGTGYTTLFPYNELERNSTISSNAASIPAGTVRRRYVPAPTVFTSDTDELDGRAGWESLLVTDVAIMMLDKEESDTSALERRRMREYARIQSMAQNRDITMPGTITDVTAYDWGVLSDVLRYRLYGDQLEFISVTYTGI